MSPMAKQCARTVNHYIEQADGNSRKAHDLWLADKAEYRRHCVEQDICWGTQYLLFVDSMEHAFNEICP